MRLEIIFNKIKQLLNVGGDYICMKTTERTENTEGIFADLTRQVIGCAIEVHRNLGPGLLESTYEQCMAHELKLTGLEFRVEQSLHHLHETGRSTGRLTHQLQCQAS